MTRARCYSDHDEDIRTKGSCDYCQGTERDGPDVGTLLDYVRRLTWELDRELSLVSSRRTALEYAIGRARKAGASWGELEIASGRSRTRCRQIVGGNR